MLSIRSALVATLLCGACTPVVMKTPVSGATSSVSRLVGDWQGEYSSVQTGRQGIISFHLKAGADTADGEVIMQPTTGAEPSAPNVAAIPWDAMRAANQVLSIRFVFVSADVLDGLLNPYRDPDCGCTLRTTFRGTISGDVIEGTFHTEGDGVTHLPSDGRWRVQRYRGK